jgi:UPF0042 nucleotide-binding protein
LSVKTRIVFVTGLSGSGKSTVARCLEDLGYYCVDNLPPLLLSELLGDPSAFVPGRDRLAVVTDMRAPGFAERVPELLAGIDRTRIRPTMVFLESSDEVLLRRFSESRRPHPFAPELPLLDCIRAERAQLRELRGGADLILDTSDWSIHDARSLVYSEFGKEVGHEPQMNVSLVSFGYKYGVPPGNDLLFDVRFLDNPHFVPDLRPLTGLDAPVQAYLRERTEFPVLVGKLVDLFRFLLPRYQQENRSYLTIAVGCTGGQHRSVATVEALRGELEQAGWAVRVQHRELQRSKA